MGSDRVRSFFLPVLDQVFQSMLSTIRSGIDRNALWGKNKLVSSLV
ncbi:hypothetical protein VCRA2113O220_290013 [Vibrio crassostreae]|nr:hypothetical protein VCRA2113O220_290013 [Vibrio crassostreae]CAK2785931.1 hypothetical protein VCRA2110O174_280060 [Vibrio crassostreae]CAK3870894.1 hypothetical protein VCRA2126O291_280060 [Vibrio crassostreae]